MGDADVIRSGKNPRLLILSGMHGDEHEVIDVILSYVRKHARQMPPFLYIPRVSPSALARKKRRNKWGHDVNREFFDPPRDEEARRVMEILLPHRFDLTINMHEDPDFARAFYLYDSGRLSPEQLTRLRTGAVNAGAGLHTGPDDPMDTDLGYHAEKGYISSPYDFPPSQSGFAGPWFARHAISRRDIIVEIPGKARAGLKTRLVDLLFSFFLTPEFGF